VALPESVLVRADVDAAPAALFDIRTELTLIVSLSEAMAKKRKKIPPELLAEHEKRYAETTRLLEERLAYHRAKREEERAARGEG
jgi:hypothetical protein